MIALIIFVGAVLMTFLIVALVEWDFSRRGTKLKFKNFKEFYEVNPERWGLNEGNVLCRKANYKYDGDAFYFGFIDYIKYMMWKRKIDRGIKLKEDNAATARMLKAVKADIKASKEAEAKQTLEAWRTWLRNIDPKDCDRVVAEILMELKEIELGKWKLTQRRS